MVFWPFVFKSLLDFFFQNAIKSLRYNKTLIIKFIIFSFKFTPIYCTFKHDGTMNFNKSYHFIGYEPHIIVFLYGFCPPPSKQSIKLARIADLPPNPTIWGSVSSIASPLYVSFCLSVCMSPPLLLIKKRTVLSKS